MIVVLAMLLACQLAGEIMARGLGLPVPGPVLGLVFLLVAMLLREPLRRLLPVAATDGTLETVSKGLLAHLSLLFVPAGVGVIQRLDVLGQHGLALSLALVASSLIGIVVSAYVFRAVARRMEKRP